MLRRLDAAGLMPSHADIIRRSIPEDEIAFFLDHAAQNDTTGRAGKYLDKFREELGGNRGSGLNRFNITGSALYRVEENRVLAGVGYDTVWSGTKPRADESDLHGAIRGTIKGSHLGAALTVQDRDITELHAVAGVGWFGVWGGRRDLGFATAHSGGVIFDQNLVDAGGIFLRRPLKLPLLGPMRLEIHLSQIDNILLVANELRPTKPWLWVDHASFEPHARIRLGVNRAMIFGGKGNFEVTPKRLFSNLIGVYELNDESGFANQMFSLESRYRLPTGKLNSVLYAEWGTDDAAGAWFRVPGIVAGLEFSALPKSDIMFGVERTQFKPNRASNSLWYQNAWFRGSWADAGRIMGHPLGGHGVEWRGFVGGGSAQHGITGELAGYTRDRGEQNILGPERLGRSVGGRLEFDARIHQALRLVLRGEVEHGTDDNDWTTSTANAGLRFRF